MNKATETTQTCQNNHFGTHSQGANETDTRI
jgi:hypothetical protein